METKKFENIKSTTLGKEIPMEVSMIVTSDGSILKLITHDALKDLARENKIVYGFKTIAISPTMAVVECSAKMPDDDYSVIGVGETNPTNLVGLATQIPVKMAYKRAFDSAIVDLLGLPHQFYSDIEIPSNTVSTPVPEVKTVADEKPSEEKPKKSRKKKTETEAETEVKTEEVAASTKIEDNSIEIKIDEAPIEAKTEEITVETETTEALAEAKPEETVKAEVEAGAPEQLTFAEVLETASDNWLKWALELFNPQTEEAKDNLKKFKEYCASKEVKTYD